VHISGSLSLAAPPAASERRAATTVRNMEHRII